MFESSQNSNFSRGHNPWFWSEKEIFKPRTFTQIHTPTVVQERVGGGRQGRWNPSPEFLICCCIWKQFWLQWKAFDLLNKTEVHFMGGGAARGL